MTATGIPGSDLASRELANSGMRKSIAPERQRLGSGFSEGREGRILSRVAQQPLNLWGYETALVGRGSQPS
jgi:hypothetical protein